MLEGHLNGFNAGSLFSFSVFLFVLAHNLCDFVLILFLTAFVVPILYSMLPSQLACLSQLTP